MERLYMWILGEMIAASSIATGLDEVEFWSRIGVKAIVVLAEAHEIAKYWGNADNYFKTLRENGFVFIHSPIKDFHAPTLIQLEELVEWIDSNIRMNKPVLVHCRAGIGRTGTVIAAYLVKNGYDAAQAIREVRRKIPLALEVDSQVSILYEYYEANRSFG